MDGWVCWWECVCRGKSIEIDPGIASSNNYAEVLVCGLLCLALVCCSCVVLCCVC